MEKKRPDFYNILILVFINQPYLTTSIYTQLCVCVHFIYRHVYSCHTFSLFSFSLYIVQSLSTIFFPTSFSVTQISSHLSVQPHTSWQTTLSLHCFAQWTTLLSAPYMQTHRVTSLRWRPAYGNMESFNNTSWVLVLGQICSQNVTPLLSWFTKRCWSI